MRASLQQSCRYGRVEAGQRPSPRCDLGSPALAYCCCPACANKWNVARHLCKPRRNCNSPDSERPTRKACRDGIELDQPWTSSDSSQPVVIPSSELTGLYTQSLSTYNDILYLDPSFVSQRKERETKYYKERSTAICLRVFYNQQY